ncbi:MAG: hypothetical protein NTV88_05235 [Candidatus Micrarchaeota archaeon]|nr:hypothetical protein [Candidatus Micrarchaeota archaeon]
MIAEKTGATRFMLFASLIAALFLLSGCTAMGVGQGAPFFDYTYLMYPLLAGILILALAFMFSKIFNLQHWTAIISDELVQVLATGLVALCLFGMQVGVDGYLVNAFTAATPTGTVPACAGHIGCANDIAYAQLSTTGVETLLNDLHDAGSLIGTEASKGIYCSMLGVGFTLTNCSQLNAFRGSLTSSSFATMAGVLDIYAQQFLLTLAKNFSFTLIIPLGLFFRCFKLSRQAGGALIAIGFGLYTAYPLAIIAGSSLLTGYATPIMTEPAPLAPNALKLTDHCDPYEMHSDVSRKQFDDYASQLTDPNIALSTTYLVICKVILMSILALIITLGFIRMLAHLLGSEIDVSSLARIS